VFLLVPVFALLAAVAMLSIPRSAIDENRARGLAERESLEAEDGETPSGYAVLLRCRPLVVFGMCAMLFHFANAPLLPLVGQKLAQAHPVWATAMMSSCIMAAQLIMLPVALAVGRTADRIGRKPILLVGFAVLPVRALLYTFSNNAAWLIGVQLLDGIGAGIFGAITPLLIADVTRGTGRYNLAQGAVATAQGMGASLSGLAAGVIVDHVGYSAAFLTFGAAACVALVALCVALPETAPPDRAAATPSG
jgi:MFS family permease